MELREDKKNVDEGKEKKEDEKNDNEIKINVINENNDKEIKNEINIIENLPRNKKSMFGQTEKSFAQVRINSNKSVCSFQSNNTIVVITYDGIYYHAQLDIKNGGNCKIINQISLNNLK